MSSNFCLPPVQAGCEEGSISRLILSPSFPYVDLVLNLQSDHIPTLFVAARIEIENLLEGVKSVLVVGLNYFTKPKNEHPNRLLIGRYAWGMTITR